MEIKYMQLPGKFLLSANDDFVNQCIDLYSNHYGIWGEKGPRPGEHVKLSRNRFSEWLSSDCSSIYYATLDDVLIGYAIAIRAKTKHIGTVTWVTQLVVHSQYRNQGIAKNLLFSIWGFSTDDVWGILSSNPYAIRALEKATRRRATPVRIKRNIKKLMSIGKEFVPYIDENTEVEIGENNSQINTNFFVSHAQTKKMLEDVTKANPWILGELKEGWEWFAFTFKDQEQFSLSKDEIQKMIECSDSVAKTAYQNMILDPAEQRWMSHTQSGIDYICEQCGITNKSYVLDIGCGIGRHSIELGRRGINCLGIDYLDTNIKKANETKDNYDLKNVQFMVNDCRDFCADQKADVVLCLYDVIGTFVHVDDNLSVIKTLYNNVKPNGYVVISVMNYESTLSHAKYTFDINKNPDELLKLPASDTMQRSGNIFNPEYYLVDTSSSVIYRKEQFAPEHQLPKELIVRDKRYTMDEIVALLNDAGFKIIQQKYVNASDWRADYKATDAQAKEILLICKKCIDENFE